MVWYQRVCLTGLILFSIYVIARYVQGISFADEYRWILRTGLRVVSGNESESKYSSNRSIPHRKFIFAFRYTDQLGGATIHLLELCSLAKYGERDVVAPYVNSSRMTGTPLGFRNRYASPLQSYFDLQQVNNKLKSNSYSTLTSFEDMAENCNRRFDVLVHFLFQGVSIERSTLNQITERELRDIKLRSKRNHGWTNCTFLGNTKLAVDLNSDFNNASRYICVDPEIIRTWEKFEEVLQGANCVGIVVWNGIGPSRTRFTLPKTSGLRPSDLQHNAQLVDLARMFVETSGLGKAFISVHVRTERHLYRRGMNATRNCLYQLAAKVQDLKRINNWNVYLSSDLVNHGSDKVFAFFKNDTKRLGFYLELKKALGYPVTLDHIQLGVYDRRAKAIIEMHILALGKTLVTLGEGSFQTWVIELSRNIGGVRHPLYRFCKLRG